MAGLCGAASGLDQTGAPRRFALFI